MSLILLVLNFYLMNFAEEFFLFKFWAAYAVEEAASALK